MPIMCLPSLFPPFLPINSEYILNTRHFAWYSMMQKELWKTKSLPLKDILSSGDQDMAQGRAKKSEIAILLVMDIGYDRRLHKVLRVPGAGCFCQRRVEEVFIKGFQKTPPGFFRRKGRDSQCKGGQLLSKERSTRTKATKQEKSHCVPKSKRS